MKYKVLMDNGQLGVHGQFAAKLVEEELRLEAGGATPHHHLEVVKFVLETRQNQYDATQSSALHVRINLFYA